MGVSVRIDLSGLSKLNRAFTRFKDKIKDRAKLNRGLAAEMLTRTRHRFDTRTTPEGKKWSSSLVDTGRLRQTLDTAADERVAKVGSNLVYAAIHQFGGVIPAHRVSARDKKSLSFTVNGRQICVKSVMIPPVAIKANPYLGISEKDEEALAEIVETYVENCTRESFER